MKTAQHRGEDVEAMEARLRALHELIPATLGQPELPERYVPFVRRLRERLHPVGIREIRDVQTDTGLRFSVDLGDRLGCDFYYGYYAEFFELQLFLGMLTAGMTVVDVGANFGAYTVSAAAAVGPQGSVHAFEPDPAAFVLLETNVKANGLGNVRCHASSVGAADGTVEFFAMEESAFSGLRPTGRSRQRATLVVPQCRLDAVFGTAPDAVAAVKIDVEGHEGVVLQGARDTIRRCPNIVLMLEVTSKNLDEAGRNALVLELRSLYDAGMVAWVPDDSAAGIRLAGDPAEVGSLPSANVFVVRHGHETEARLRDVAARLRGEHAVEVARWITPLPRTPSAPPRHARVRTSLRGAVSRFGGWASRRAGTSSGTESRSPLIGRPVVSIVLGSYNRSRLIQQALDTIRSECAGVAHEIIVIDGGSDDGALEWLVRQKDIVTVVQYNRGEIAGRTLPRRSWGYFMNLGFKAAQGKYVLMLSDDCLLIRGAVNTGVQYAEDLQQAGRRIGGIGFYFRNWPDEVEYYVQATIGGKLMVNHGLFLRRALEEVGWADEDRYRFYKADGDLSLRLWEAGYEIVDCPGAFVEHYVDAGEVVRRSNSAVLDRDRLAYRDRWEPVYPNGSGYGRLTLSFEDPENTARRFVQALAHDE